MPIVVIGISHQTAPVAIREKVAFSEQQLRESLTDSDATFEEKLILSTCNRTEIYASTSEPVNPKELNHWYAKQQSDNQTNLEPYIYQFTEDDAIQHAFRVACGLDSLVLGEPQILGQLKMALNKASEHKAVGNKLNRLMQHAFATAKKVRTDTDIGSNSVSVAYTAVNLARQIFSDIHTQTALLIGAGETIELVGRHLLGAGVKRIIIANRSINNATILAESLGAEVIGLADISEYLQHADIVISSTAATIPIIGKGSVERALKQRKHKPIFMVDIAVPRDIEAEVGELNDIYLYTVDDLQSVIDSNIDTRRRAAKIAEAMIANETQVFLSWLSAQQRMEQVKQYRAQLLSTKNEVLDKALKQLKNGKSAEEALQFLAHTLTNKLGHHPTQAMNRAAHQGDLNILDTAEQLLGLSTTPTTKKEDSH